jgi:hypothetical protein
MLRVYVGLNAQLVKHPCFEVADEGDELFADRSTVFRSQIQKDNENASEREENDDCDVIFVETVIKNRDAWESKVRAPHDRHSLEWRTMRENWIFLFQASPVDGDGLATPKEESESGGSSGSSAQVRALTLLYIPPYSNTLVKMPWFLYYFEWALPWSVGS